MKRIKAKRKADAILSADWHIRPDTPVCRTDDFTFAMWQKIEAILALSKENGCPVIVAGDVGNEAYWPNWLLEKTIKIFEGHEIIAIPGQHDLPNHKIDLFDKSGLGVLTAAGVVNTIFRPILVNNQFGLFPFPYGTDIEKNRKKSGSPNVAIVHQMVIEDKPLWPDQEAPKGHQLLKILPEYDLILSGDNHNPFVAKYKDRLLVNPGSMMRTRADQIGHKPRVYLWYAQTNEVEPYFLPIKDGVITREHMGKSDEKKIRMDSYVKRAKESVEIMLSFQDNLEEYLKANRTPKSVRDKIWEAADGDRKAT